MTGRDTVNTVIISCLSENIQGTVYKPRRQRGKGVVKMSMFVYEGGGGSQGSVYVNKTYQFQRILNVKYKFLRGLFIFLQTQLQEIVDEMAIG